MKQPIIITLLGFALTCSIPGDSLAKTKKQSTVQKTVDNTLTHRCNGMDVTIQFYSPSIVRVTKNVADKPMAKKSYSVIMTPQKEVALKKDATANGISAASECIKVCLDTDNGEIAFYNAKGDILIKDTKTVLTPRDDEANKGK